MSLVLFVFINYLSAWGLGGAHALAIAKARHRARVICLLLN